MPTTVTVDLEKIEDVCDHVVDLHIELADLADLNGMERLLVMARLTYIAEQTLGRVLSPIDRAEFERVRAMVIARAEESRTANLAEDAAGVNSEGGSA